MQNATLTISLPRLMKEYIAERLREGRFSTPSEYIRSLIRNDQDLKATPRPGALAGRDVPDGSAGTIERPRLKRKK